MSRRRPAVMLAVIAVLFFGGLAALFRLRLGSGDVFPAYSSFRADPLGTRAWYEALRELPEVRTERMMKPLERLAELPARTLIVAGVDRRRWENFSVKEANALEAAVRAGSRAVVVFSADVMDLDPDHEAERRAAAAEEKERERLRKKGAGAKETKGGKTDKTAVDDDRKKTRGGPRNDEAQTHAASEADWARRWGVEAKKRLIMDKDAGALATKQAPVGVPADLPWKSDVYFSLAQGSDWRVLYTRGSSPVMIEMALGRGTVAMATDAYFLSNEAMQNHRHAPLLAWLAGTTGRIVFCESALGVEEDPGLAALARRYGLAGAFMTTMLLAALFVWRRMVLFVPPPAGEREVSLSYQPAASLEALLRRAVPAGKLIDTCAGEWMRTARAGDAAKVAATLSEQPAKASPENRYNAAVRALKRR